MDSNKSYTCTAQLGQTTTTGDKEGEVLQDRTIPSFTSESLEEILNNFRGDIKQVPPMYSALKHNGQPLYKLARQGIEIKRKERSVTIFDLDLLDHTSDSITLNIRCSKGTYIRTLAQDIGETLGCGAHLSMLRRTNVEPFDCSKLYTIEELEQLASTQSLDDTLLPIDSALPDQPALSLSDDELKRIQFGLKVSRRDIPDSQIIRLYSSTNQFIGIGRISSDKQLTAKRLMRTN